MWRAAGETGSFARPSSLAALVPMRRCDDRCSPSMAARSRDTHRKLRHDSSTPLWPGRLAPATASSGTRIMADEPRSPTSREATNERHRDHDDVHARGAVALPDEKDYELVDGRLVEPPLRVRCRAGWRASCTSGSEGCETHLVRMGRPRGHRLPVLSRGPGQGEKPDVSFIRGDRLPLHVSKGYP